MLSHYSSRDSLKYNKRVLEQYPTPTSLAAHMVWVAYMKNKLVDKTILDMGCGNGILTIASLIAGARRGVCLDIDDEILSEAIRIINERYREFSYRVVFVNSDAVESKLANIDTVVMNPPFGIARSNRGIDLRFLRNALRNSRYVFSLHKYSEGLVRIVNNLVELGEAELDWLEELYLEIPMIYPRHRRKTYRVKALFIGLGSKVS